METYTPSLTTELSNKMLARKISARWGGRYILIFMETYTPLLIIEISDKMLVQKISATNC